MRSPIDCFVDWLEMRLEAKREARRWQRRQTPKEEREPPPYQERHTDRIAAMLSTLPMPRVPRCPPAPASVPARPAGPTTNVLRQYGHFGRPKKPGERVRLYERLKHEGKL